MDGIFETIAVYHGKPIFLNSHLDRLEKGLTALAIENNCCHRNELEKEILSLAVGKHRVALKIEIDRNEICFTEREIPYTPTIYSRGFDLMFSDVIRDETMITTYYKTSNRTLLDAERKKAVKRGFQEVIFMNSRGNVVEGSVSNLFYVSDGTIYTPGVSSGLLDGVLRRFLLSVFPEIRESVVTKEDLLLADEIFLTNSLMGIMPVRSLQGKRFLTGGKGTRLSAFYMSLLDTLG